MSKTKGINCENYKCTLIQQPLLERMVYGAWRKLGKIGLPFKGAWYKIDKHGIL